jgi:hypothetical protein
LRTSKGDQYIQDWIRKESEIQEEESRLALLKFLKESGYQNLKCLGRKFKLDKGRKQEWDAVVFCQAENALFVSDCKHNFTADDITMISERVKLLKEAVEGPFIHDRCDLTGVTVRTVVGGLLFPDYLLKKAHELGFITIYPSGDRLTTVAPLSV